MWISGLTYPRNVDYVPSIFAEGTMLDLNSALTEITKGGVVVDIGSIEPRAKKALDRFAKRGDIAKWRGKWFPVAGADFGIGPDKTCYGLHETQEGVTFSKRVLPAEAA